MFQGLADLNRFLKIETKSRKLFYWPSYKPTHFNIEQFWQQWKFFSPLNYNEIFGAPILSVSKDFILISYHTESYIKLINNLFSCAPLSCPPVYYIIMKSLNIYVWMTTAEFKHIKVWELITDYKSDPGDRLVFLQQN